MKTIALVGYPLGHSFSKRYFTEKFEREKIDGFQFKNYALPTVGLIKEMIEQEPSLIGFNITIPYKQQIMELLDQIDPQAQTIGAVNCVRVIREPGYTGKILEGIRLVGYNTDAYGFCTSLLEMIGTLRPSALVLGAGGASKAVQSVLGELSIPFTVVSRTTSNADKSYDALTPQEINSCRLIINTTPLGTYPDTTTAPAIDYSCIGKDHFAYDLVYNPSDTLFTHRCRQQGATVMSGYRMLKQQAERGWDIFTTPLDQKESV